MSATATPTMPAEAMAGRMLSVDELADLNENSEQKYREAVIAAARTGATPSPRDLLITVSVMGRNSVDFLRDVERVRQRIAAVADIEAAEAMKPEESELHDAYLKEQAKLRELIAECKARIAAQKTIAYEAKSKRESLHKTIDRQQKFAFKTLRETADPAIEQELAAAEKEVERLKDLRNDPMDDIHYAHRLRRVGDVESDAYQHEITAIRADAHERVARAEAGLSQIHRRRHIPERFKIT